MNKVLIADHHHITNTGIACLIGNNNNLEVIGKVTNGKDLFKFLETHKPDVLIMEIDMPHINGINTLRTIKTDFPSTKTLILSCHPEEMYALNAIKAGAAGYISKTASTEKILNAIIQVARGGIYLNKDISERLSKGLNKGSGLIARYRRLSTRESEVLSLLSSGKRNKDIAEALDINEKTVSTYKTRLLKKLKVDNLAELINQSRLLELTTATSPY